MKRILEVKRCYSIPGMDKARRNCRDIITWLCLGDSHEDDKNPGPITKVKSFPKCATVAQHKNPQDFSDALFSNLALPRGLKKKQTRKIQVPKKAGTFWLSC